MVNLSWERKHWATQVFSCSVMSANDRKNATRCLELQVNFSEQVISQIQNPWVVRLNCICIVCVISATVLVIYDSIYNPILLVWGVNIIDQSHLSHILYKKFSVLPKTSVKSWRHAFDNWTEVIFLLRLSSCLSLRLLSSIPAHGVIQLLCLDFL